MERKRIRQNVVEKIDLLKYTISPKIVTQISEKTARKYTIVPLEMDEDTIKIAMSDIDNIDAIRDVEILTHRKVYPIQADKEDIKRLINQGFSTSKAEHMVKEVHDKSMQKDIQKDYLKFIESIIEEAIAIGVSDIHIEPLEKEIKIRYRIDGYLQERQRFDQSILNAVITCIKIMANLDIADKRIPQDGRVTKVLGGEKVYLRVSILPTIFGEKAMIRIIYPKGVCLTSETLGVNKKDLEKFKKLFKYPHGLILITGPTGSGKSTTLATILREMNKTESNIITIEDPVETIIEGTNQVIVNNKAGLTFGTILRSILRQDPDILMIGEIRDEETMQIAVRSAITGHLVLSTLHTHDTTSTLLRLMDMGVEAFMVGAAIRGVIAQRLVRKICPECKESYKVTKEEENLYGIKEGTTVYRGKGCKYCYGTGYKGRKAVYEVLVIEQALRELIGKESFSLEAFRKEVIKRGMRTLTHNVYEDVLLGITTLEEMMKIVYEF